MRKLFFLFASLVFVACATGVTRLPAGKREPLTVIAITDFHGALEAEEFVGPGGKPMTIGGAALMSSYIQKVREQAPGPSLLIDAGDLFQGTLASNLYEGAPVVRLYNHLDVSAAALGNHEFDFGPAGEKAVPRSPSDDAQGALKERIRESKFPILAANVRDEEGKLPTWLKASIVKKVGDVKVGIVGAADEHTPTSTNVLNLRGLKFLDPVGPVAAEARRLREEEGVDAVVLTIHVGGGCDDNSTAKLEDYSSCGIKDIIEMAKRLPEGLVDVIVAGHTHRGLAKRVGSTMILQAYSSGKYVSWATVDLDRQAKPALGGMVPVCAEVFPTARGKTCDPFSARFANGPIEPAIFMGARMQNDPAVVKLLSPEIEEVKEMKSRPIGSSVADPFIRSYDAESALGNMVADLSREMLPDIEIGMTNGGGLRANLQPGPLNYGHIFNLAPFDNQLAVMSVTGEQIYQLAKVGLFGGKGILLWSSNVQVETDLCEVSRITIDGAPLDRSRIYKVGSSDYLAGGGSGINRVGIRPEQVVVYWDRPYILRDLMADGLSRWRKVLHTAEYMNPKQPRIKIGRPCPPTATPLKAKQKPATLPH